MEVLLSFLHFPENGSWLRKTASYCSHIFLVRFSQMTQAQLETLQTENQHLKGLLQRLESQSPQVCLLYIAVM